MFSGLAIPSALLIAPVLSSSLTELPLVRDPFDLHPALQFAYNALDKLQRIPQDISSHLSARQASSGLCGPTAGGAGCGPAFCCSADGLCGKGGYYCTAPSCQFQYGPSCDANKSPSGSNTSAIPRPSLGNLPYGVSISHCTVPGTVALTFDDGPYPYTSDLLDILRANNATATFFITAVNGAKGSIDDTSTPYPALLRRMHAEGHQIASHTWSHQNLSAITHQQRMDQMIKNEMAFRNVLNFFPTYMRPPYDICTPESGCIADMQALGYHVTLYDVDTDDWMGNYTNSQQIFTTALNKGGPTKAPELVLGHDIYNATVHDFAPFMLGKLKQLGYRAVPVGVCLNDPPEFWYRDPTTGGAITASPTSNSSNASATASATGKMTTAGAILKGLKNGSSGYLDVRDGWPSAFALVLIVVFAVLSL